ncbi:MAG TPA: PepSY domain-containing protein [Casimicrobiaceae bacterium]|nr:PepSY domain-containing protein [Casimicrobiaceae bacterium]
MKHPRFVAIALSAVLLAGASSSVYAVGYSAGAIDQPKITMNQAREIGLDRVPDGTVLAERLEHRDGRPVWFLDIAGYNRRSRQEVLVDADTGRVLGSHARALEGPPRAAVMG